MRSGGYAALRWAGIGLLSAALLLTLPRGAQRQAPFRQLLDGIRAGQVTMVQLHVEGTDIAAVWHEGPLRWYRADGPFDTDRQIQEAMTTPGARSVWLSHPGHDRLWIQAVSDADEPTALAFAAGLLYLWLFVVMLLSREHSYANRWAWFWLFVVGGIGPILMLFKEPEPLRLRRRRSAPRIALEPLSGGTGLACAVLWAVGLALGGSLVAAVLR